MAEMTLTLEKPANRSGGDKYSGMYPEYDPRPIVIYIPQKISRIDGVPARKVRISIEPFGLE